MELEKVRKYFNSLPGAFEDMPFGPDVIVVKVMEKMFALIAWKSSPLTISLKCEPQHAMALRSMFEAINPGYHLNKQHWNTVTLDGTIPEDLVREMIDDSYRLVVSKLTKKKQIELGELQENKDG